MVNGILKKKLQKHRNAKVLCFPGTRINAMNHHLMSIIAKQPNYLILHVGTNDSTTNTFRKVIDGLLMLKCLILKPLPNWVVVSKTEIRIDHRKVNLRLHNANKHLETLNLECIKNGNISVKHVGRTGVQLNSNGRSRFTLNFLNQIRKLLRHLNEHLNEPLLSHDPSNEVDHKVSGPYYW